MTSLSPVTERAVIPAAGLASRLSPVSEVVPKPLFPVGRYPAIEWVVAEAVANGCREIAVVINRAQSEIERYLRRRGREAGAGCRLEFVVQDEPRGFGHAILLTREFCANLPFAVLLPDDLLDGSRPPLEAMAEAFRKTGGAVFAVVSATKGGPFRLRDLGGNLHRVEAIDKKSTFEKGEMALTGIGRYLLQERIVRKHFGLIPRDQLPPGQRLQGSSQSPRSRAGYALENLSRQRDSQIHAIVNRKKQKQIDLRGRQIRQSRRGDRPHETAQPSDVALHGLPG